MDGDCRDTVRIATSSGRMLSRCWSNLDFKYSNLSNYRFNHVQSIPVNSGQVQSIPVLGGLQHWKPGLRVRESHIPRGGASFSARLHLNYLPLLPEMSHSSAGGAGAVHSSASARIFVRTPSRQFHVCRVLPLSLNLLNCPVI